jgi:hypothetical protein
VSVTMSGGGDLVDTIKEFMRGSEWQENIQIFVEANCSGFAEDPSRSGGFTHGHFKTWKNFQEICESILALALDDAAGCSMNDFERALDELSREAASGPREGAKREILSQLLTYADFNDFATMMNVAVTYQYPNKLVEAFPPAAAVATAPTESAEDYPDNRDENRGILLELSFPRRAVEHVIAHSARAASLDHLIDQLQKLPPEIADAKEEPKARRRSNSGGGGGSDNSLNKLPKVSEAKGGEDQYPEYDASSYGAPGAGAGAGAGIDQEQLETECINAFALETLQDSGELRAKFVIALSVLDTVDGGNMNAAVLEQLTWASAMCTLFQEIVLSFSTGVPFEQYCFTHCKGLPTWFDELDKLFLSLKGGLGHGAAVTEAELSRVAVLEDLASMGSEDERLLHGLISRHEDVLRELSAQHAKCILMTSPAARGATIERGQLEELYLYLKEQVHWTPGGVS